MQIGHIAEAQDDCCYQRLGKSWNSNTCQLCTAKDDHRTEAGQY